MGTERKPAPEKAGRGEWKILLIGSLIFIGFGIAMVINPFTMIKYTVIFAGCVMLANGVVDFCISCTDPPGE